MNRALAWIRKSKGSDEDIGLQQQRRDIPALAGELADDATILDLGVQSGFSTMTRDPDADTTWLDQHPDVKLAVDELRNGEYDYLVAYDDRRICRDDYLSVIEYAIRQGDAEIVYLSDDVQEDDLAYDIHRRVERQTKEEEIKRAKAAIRERQERGYYQGRPPIGLQFDEEGKYLVPGDRFENVIDAIGLVESGASYRDVEETLGISPSTLSGVMVRKEQYLAHIESAE